MILTTDEIKEKCFGIFDKTGYVQRAYLFGSYARNEATEKSNVDIVIVLSHYVGGEYFCLYGELQDAFNKNVDVLTEDEVKNNSSLARQIDKDKVLIYER